MEHIGARIAARWLLTRGRENVADLLPGPVLPTVIDKELLVEAEEEISRSLRPYEEARRALRDGFWAKLHHEFGLPTPAAAMPSHHPGQPAPAHPAPPRAGQLGPPDHPRAPGGRPTRPIRVPGAPSPVGPGQAGNSTQHPGHAVERPAPAPDSAPAPA